MPPEMRQGRQRVKDSINYVSRGIADNYLLLEEEGFCERAVNIIIDSSKRTRPHPGTRLINRGGGRPKRLNHRVPIDALYSFGDKHLLAISGGLLFRYDEEADRYIRIRAIGDLGNPIFPMGRDYTFAEINNEVVIASGELERPFLVYIDTSRPTNIPNGHYLELPHPRIEDTVPAGTPTVTGNAYRYAFVFTREYQSSGFNKEDFGDITFHTREEVAGRNTYTFNFPLDEQVVQPLHGPLKLQVYRSQINSNALYRIAELDYDYNATSDLTFTDDLRVNTDTMIAANARLYQEDANGPRNAPPPRARYAAAGDGRVYLAGLEDSRGTIPNRVIYSQIGAIHGFPLGNLNEFDYDITGLTYYKSTAIAFTLYTAHRLESVGGGAITSYEFENVSGAISPRSVLSITEGVFYASHDGIYVADGHRAIKLSDHLSDFYSKIPRKEEIAAFYDSNGDRIYFHYQRNGLVKAPMSEGLILDLLHSKAVKNGGVFTQYSEFSAKISLESLLFSRAWTTFKQRIYRGNADGTVSIVDSQYYDREILDFRDGQTEHRHLPGFVDFISGGLIYGHHAVKKNISRLYIITRAKSNGSLLFSAISDGGAYVARPSSYDIDSLVDLNDPALTVGAMERLGQQPIVTSEKTLGREGAVININQIRMESAPYKLLKDVDFVMEFYAAETGMTAKIVSINKVASDFARSGEFPLLDHLLQLKSFIFPERPEDYSFVNILPLAEVPFGPTEFGALPLIGGVRRNRRSVWSANVHFSIFRILAADGTDKTFFANNAGVERARYLIQERGGNEDFVERLAVQIANVGNFLEDGDRFVVHLDSDSVSLDDVPVDFDDPRNPPNEDGTPGDPRPLDGDWFRVLEANGREPINYQLDSGSRVISYHPPDNEEWRFVANDDEDLSFGELQVNQPSRAPALADDLHYQLTTASRGAFERRQVDFTIGDSAEDIVSQLAGLMEGDEDKDVVSYHLFRLETPAMGAADTRSFWNDITYSDDVRWRNPTFPEVFLTVTNTMPGERYRAVVILEPLEQPEIIPEVLPATRETLDGLTKRPRDISYNGPGQLVGDQWDIRPAPAIELTKEDIDPTLGEADTVRLSGKMDILQHRGMDFELLDISAEGEPTSSPRNP